MSRAVLSRKVPSIVTIGDGLACLAAAIAAVGIAWAAAWGTVRSAASRAEALRNIGPATWQTKSTTRRPAS